MNPKTADIDGMAARSNEELRAREAQKRERVAKAIFWRMNSIMHDHEENWRTCGKREIYRDCADAALAVK
jgi:hypothetical protein